MREGRSGAEDRVRFEQVYYIYKDAMLRLALGILRNRDDAEDAVQDAFESVSRNLDKITDLYSARTRSFLMIVTEHKAIDLYRDRRKREAEELQEAEGVLFPLPEEGLGRCIRALPPRYREMILLKYCHGYSTREAAEILSLSPAAASKLDQRAKNRLLELCRREGIL